MNKKHQQDKYDVWYCKTYDRQNDYIIITKNSFTYRYRLNGVIFPLNIEINTIPYVEIVFDEYGSSCKIIKDGHNYNTFHLTNSVFSPYNSTLICTVTDVSLLNNLQYIKDNFPEHLY